MFKFGVKFVSPFPSLYSTPLLPVLISPYLFNIFISIQHYWMCRSFALFGILFLLGTSCHSHKLLLGFDIHMSVHRNIITNYSEQDATFLEFISTDALHVSGGSSTHHQEHVTVHTASGMVKQYYC